MLPENEFRSASMAGAIQKNIQSLGFTFSPEAFRKLSSQSPEFLEKLYSRLLPVLKEMIGADKVYEPFYPNFPNQVMEMEDSELFLNAIIHYISFGTLYPDYPKEERFPLIGDPDLKVIRQVSEEEFFSVFTNLLSANVPLSQTDYNDLDWFFENIGNFTDYLPKEIPCKETIGYFGMKMLEMGRFDAAKHYFRTATDVLRLMAIYSNSDVSLSGKIYISKMNRKTRRFFMDLLSECGNLSEDMFRFRDIWIIAGEIIHPGEFEKNKKYESVCEAFRLLREGDRSNTFSHKIEHAMETGNLKSSLSILAKRPGEFARRLDQMFRIWPGKSEKILEEFAKCTGGVSTRVLWQAYLHFVDREQEVRLFPVKSRHARAYIRDGFEKPIDEAFRRKVVKTLFDAIREQYKALEPLGNVYIDPQMKDFAAPMTLRDASSFYRQVARGSVFRIPDSTKVIRPFIWWTNMNDGTRVDIDLSALFMDADMNYISHVSYTGLKAPGIGCFHSGDITDGGDFGGEGVSEFIDMDIDRMKKGGVRYVVVQVYNFLKYSFNEMPVLFGWMEREDSMSGEVYEPRTVTNAYSVTGPSCNVTPVVIDLKERCIKWLDIASIAGNRIEAGEEYSRKLMKAYASKQSVSLYWLLFAHASARGSIVTQREEADIIFSNDQEIPKITVVTLDEDGNPKEETVEKDVVMKDAYDLAYYAGLI